MRKLSRPSQKLAVGELVFDVEVDPFFFGDSKVTNFAFDCDEWIRRADRWLKTATKSVGRK